MILAARLHSFGDVPVVEAISEPAAQDNEELVDIILSSMNPLDLWVAEGSVAGGAQQLPFTLGCEAVGLVGDRRVIVNGAGVGTVRPGVHAQRVAAPPQALIEVPPAVTDADAAALAVAGITAKRIVDIGQVKPDETIVVLGASGGVGSIAIQIARGLGARVVAVTSSESKASYLQGLGASDVLVSGLDELATNLRDVIDDAPAVVLNPLGGPSVGLAIEILRESGRQIVFGRSAGDAFSASAAALYRKNVTVVGYGGLIDSADDKNAALAWLFRSVADGTLIIPIQDELPLAEFPQAFSLLKDGTVTGKILVRMPSSTV